MNHLQKLLMVVPIFTWVFISIHKIVYRMLRQPDGTIHRELGEALDPKTAPNAYPVDGVFSFDQIINYCTGLRCRVYRMAPPGSPLICQHLFSPLGDEIVPVVIFFHGGSFAHSTIDSTYYDFLCRQLVRFCNIVVVSVNYRRAPENRCPCAYDDGFMALAWVHSMPWLRSGDDSKARVYLMGDSNGGNIAHHVAVMAAGSGLEICGNILVNPMFGGMERTATELALDGRYFVTIEDRDWYWRAFLPLGTDRNHVACNPFGPFGADLRESTFPRSLIVVASLDLLSEWQERYADGLKNAGKFVKFVYMEGATVGFYFLPNNPYYFNLMNTIKRFVRPPILVELN